MPALLVGVCWICDWVSEAGCRVHRTAVGAASLDRLRWLGHHILCRCKNDVRRDPTDHGRHDVSMATEKRSNQNGKESNKLRVLQAL